MGFGLCCRFNVWKQEVDALTDRSGLETVREIGIVPGELVYLGWEYFQNRGRSTFLTVFVEANIRAASIETMGLVTLQPTPTVDAPSEYKSSVNGRMNMKVASRAASKSSPNLELSNWKRHFTMEAH